MTKTLLALFALAALASPAAAEDSIKVSLVGKTPTMIHADITRAAETLCARESVSPLWSYSSCVSGTVRDTEAQIGMNAKKPVADKLASAQ